MSQVNDPVELPDQPWNSRTYGRIRLNEGDANDLFFILREETDRRIHAAIEAKEAGDKQKIGSTKHALKRVNRMRKYTWDLMVEKGWQNDH